MGRIFGVLVFALAFVGCGSGDGVSELDTLFLGVESSAAASEEERRIEDVWEYIYENRVYVAVYAISPLGKKIDINDLPDSVDLEEVEVVFSKGDEKRSYRWAPIDSEKIYILFREK
ncbi:hypothetical protein [Microbulbifer aggregans]|uniref:hypothetical protein n=1 Tax=Microbulbifer aggregans TaxID=1769779 RepID=UPI001CFF115C|nr:hypothetical protein [Microbulbifer aggregans]